MRHDACRSPWTPQPALLVASTTLSPCQRMQTAPPRYKFVDESLANLFQCTVCMEVCMDAVGCMSGPCAMLLCASCAVKLRAQGMPCPRRCSHSAILYTTPNSFARIQINQLRVQCLRCKQTLDWTNWRRHDTADCPARNMACSVPGCAFKCTEDAMMQAHHAKDFAEHMSLYDAHLRAVQSNRGVGGGDGVGGSDAATRALAGRALDFSNLSRKAKTKAKDKPKGKKRKAEEDDSSSSSSSSSSNAPPKARKRPKVAVLEAKRPPPVSVDLSSSSSSDDDEDMSEFVAEMAQTHSTSKPDKAAKPATKPKPKPVNIAERAVKLTEVLGVSLSLCVEVATAAPKRPLAVQAMHVALRAIRDGAVVSSGSV